jgi:hypothetical protein
MWAVSMSNDSTYPWRIFNSREGAEKEQADRELYSSEIFPVDVSFDDKVKPKAKARAVKRPKP